MLPLFEVDDVGGDTEIRLRFADYGGIELHILGERAKPNLWFSAYLCRLCLVMPRFAILVDMPRFLGNRILAESETQKRIAAITDPLLNRLEFDLGDGS